MDKKKKTTIEDLEKRVLALENAIRFIPIPCGKIFGTQIEQYSFYCKWCNGYVSFCPGHTLC